MAKRNPKYLVALNPKDRVYETIIKATGTKNIYKDQSIDEILNFVACRPLDSVSQPFRETLIEIQEDNNGTSEINEEETSNRQNHKRKKSQPEEVLLKDREKIKTYLTTIPCLLKFQTNKPQNQKCSVDHTDNADQMSGYWRMLEGVSTDFHILPPGAILFNKERPHWLQTEKIPFHIKKESEKKGILSYPQCIKDTSISLMKMSDNADVRLHWYGRTPSKKDDDPTNQKISKLPVPVKPPTAKGPMKDASFYNMNHPRRGKVIIFTHITFRHGGRSQRVGALVDEKALVEQFKKLQFDVVVLRDLEKKDVMGYLKTVANEDHTDADCLIVVVMTHGDSQELSAFDESYKVSRIWEPFTANKCPTLAGKPKLFFIQACRGTGVDDGVKLEAHPFRMTMTDSASMPHITYTIPTTADILIAYATFDGQFAWRSPANGSWFIQCLCDVLNDHGDQQDILHLLTIVNCRVATEYESTVPEDSSMNKKKQMPNFVSTLTRLLIFHPKKHAMVETEI